MPRPDRTLPAFSVLPGGNTYNPPHAPYVLKQSIVAIPKVTYELVADVSLWFQRYRGIAVAIGAMVDASIIIIENIHKKLEEWDAAGQRTPRRDAIIAAADEHGMAMVFTGVRHFRH